MKVFQTFSKIKENSRNTGQEMKIFSLLCVHDDRPTKRLMTVTTWDFIVTCFCSLLCFKAYAHSYRLDETNPHWRGRSPLGSLRGALSDEMLVIAEKERESPVSGPGAFPAQPHNCHTRPRVGAGKQQVCYYRPMQESQVFATCFVRWLWCWILCEKFQYLSPHPLIMKSAA